MSSKKSNRRRFLSSAFTGTAAAAGAAALAPSASARPKQGKATKKVITRPGEPLAPEAILSPAIQFGNLLFVSGVGGYDPKTHKVVEGGVSDQVRQCLENIKTVLEAAGSSLDRVLKVSVFLTDIANFQDMNKVYRTFFPTNPPARSTVAVKELPGLLPVEIDCIAYVD